MIGESTHQTRTAIPPFLFLLFALSLSATILFAEVVTKTGEIHGMVTDDKKVPLSYVSVTLESRQIGVRQTVTTEGGTFRFVNLPPGSYKAIFTHSGFAKIIVDEIRVITGKHVEVSVTMNSSLQHIIHVTADRVFLDRNKISNSITYTQEYLEKIPNGRDPWFIIAMTPGVDSSRLDTGTGSIFQSAFFGRGDSFTNNNWTYDGLNHTDPGNPGTPPAYYDFEAFEEIQIVTGANDVSFQTGGVSINLVTKQGGNNWDGQASLFRAHDVRDYGFHAGGPLIKNKFFLWGGYRFFDDHTKDDVIIRESSKLQDFNIKLRFNLDSAHTTQVGYFRADKTVEDRDVLGNSAPAALVDQTTGPGQGIWTLEHSWLPTEQLLLNVRYGYVGTDAIIEANGGRDKPIIRLDAIGRFENTGYTFGIRSKSHRINIDGNYFRERLMGGNHDFRFGFEYRTADLQNLSTYGNGVSISDYYQTIPNGPLTSGYVSATHVINPNMTARNASMYFSDAFSTDRLMLNLGIRYDYQTGKNKPSEGAAVPGFEEFVGPFSYPGSEELVATNDFSPRLGLTYTLTEDDKTLLRANYARYYDAFNPNFISHSNPSAVLNGVFFSYENGNGDRTITPDELIDGPFFFGGNADGTFDLDAFANSRIYDSNLSNAWTNEFILGIEREITKDLSVGATLNFRRYGNFLRILPFGVTTDQYIPGGVYSADTTLGIFSVPYFVLGYVHDGTAILKNIRDYEQSYQGLEISIQKRMSNNFLFNGFLTIQRQNGHYEGGDSLAIQTQQTPGLGATYPYDPTNLPFLQDQPYSYAGFGGSQNPFSEWSLKFSGVYLFPWNMSAGTFIRYQQGYPMVLFAQVDDNTLRAFYGVANHNIVVEPIGSRRYDDIFTIDFQLQKTFDFGSKGRLTGIFTSFNITNNQTVTIRKRFVNLPDLNDTVATLDGRTYTFGLRYSF